MVFSKSVNPISIKYCMVAVVLTVLLTSLLLGQTGSNHGLQLTGSFMGVHSKFFCESDNRVQYVSDRGRLKAFCKSGNKVQYAFEVDLYLQFRNETDTPLMIFRPGGFYDKKKLVFMDTFSSKSDSEETTIFPFREYYDPVPALLRELAAAEPSKNVFVIIEPRGYYECRDTFTVQKGYKLEVKPGQESWEVPPTPESPELKVEYSLPLSNRYEASDALATAKRQWKKFGELLLDSNGDYHVKSEIILNKLTE
jgi:hypothetical protein